MTPNPTASRSADTPAVVSVPRPIEYLSPAAQVSMADRWFEIASIDHFWIRRRFEVLQRLAGHLIGQAEQLAEIGCGHGLLQRQIEDAYGKGVTGFDLNAFALQRNESRISRVCCYDIFERQPDFAGRFDVIFLFDVLEHISNDEGFLNAVLFHLKPQGILIINVPAGQWAFSSYDTAAGHIRRYTMRTLRQSAARSGLIHVAWTYWGLPLVPVLLLRKLWLLGQRNQSTIISAGFDSRSATVNKVMHSFSKLEPLPQRFLGTSLMLTLQR